MRISIAELSANSSGAVRTANQSGAPVHIVNARRSGQPTEAVIVSAELWDEILRVPSVRKRIREHTAAKQTQNEGNGLPDVA